MKSLRELMKMIELPREAAEILYDLENRLPLESVAEDIRNLTEYPVWRQTWQKLKSWAAPDERGFRMLLLMLHAAAWSYDKYEACGISEKIFADTMKCFPRFMEEYREAYGVYGFDRDFWVGRQLSLQLFRLGELEFEKTMDGSQRTIEVHIPSDAVLTEENCRSSLKMAVRFFQKYDEAYTDAPYACESWLLSPVLKELLPETSRIIRFQNLFTIQSTDADSREFMWWIFRKREAKTEDLPQNTSLQRNVRQHLLKGGKIGSGQGCVKPEYLR